MKLTMIVNPNAGKKQGLKVAEQAKAELTQRGFQIETLVSTKAGETATLAESLNIDNVQGILAVGGDGTLFEVVNGLLKNRDDLSIPLGQIPVGTGNSFIKDLGINSVEEALDVISSKKTRPVDLGHFTYSGGQHYFINLLGSGFVSNVAYRGKKYKALGSLSYIFGVLEELVVLKSTPIELNIDGEIIKRDAIFTEICNSKYTGGDMMMAPGAEIDDGLFDVIVLNKINRRKLLSLFPAIFKGKHVDDPAMEVFRGKKVVLTSRDSQVLTPDGETFGTTPLEAQMHHHKIRMFG